MSAAKRILLVAAGVAFVSAASAGIQTKTLKIYNNTPEKLYAIMKSESMIRSTSGCRAISKPWT